MASRSPLPLVTVVCNVYNDAERVEAALESVLSQTGAFTLEVVVVDDASTDDTPARIKAIAARQSNLRYTRRESGDGTPGAAKNIGLEMARGDYIAFTDSDDRMAPNALATLVGLLNDGTVDLAVGRIRRQRSSGSRSTWEPSAYADGHLVVGGLAHNLHLLQDTIDMGKLFRAPFLREHNLRFPEGILYEDQPFMTRVWASAARVATTSDAVYYWSVSSDSASPSITSRRHEIQNYEHRIKANRLVDLEIAHLPEVRTAKMRKFVSHDFALYARELVARDKGYVDEFVKATRAYLADLPRDSIEALSPSEQAAVASVAVLSPANAAAALAFLFRSHWTRSVLTSEGDRWFWPSQAGDPGRLDLTQLVTRLQRARTPLHTLEIRFAKLLWGRGLLVLVARPIASTATTALEHSLRLHRRRDGSHRALRTLSSRGGVMLAVLPRLDALGDGQWHLVAQLRNPPLHVPVVVGPEAAARLSAGAAHRPSILRRTRHFSLAIRVNSGKDPVA